MTEREIARKKAAARKARKERERKQRNRRVVLTVCLMLAVCVGSIGGTIAWLTDKTETVQNTFSSADINIKLEETKKSDGTTLASNESWSAKLIPGKTYTKNPVVTVEKGSEKCWLFVKVTETNNPSTYLDYTYTMTQGNEWYDLSSFTTPVSGVYARIVDANATADQSWNLITGKDGYTDGFVTVKTAVVKSGTSGANVVVMPGADEMPSISFQAYAVQYSSFEQSGANQSNQSYIDKAIAVWNQHFASTSTN